MKILILSEDIKSVLFIKNIIHFEKSECYCVSTLCELEHMARQKIFDFLLIDNSCFIGEKYRDIIHLCLVPINDRIPVVYFDKTTFSVNYDLNRCRMKNTHIRNVKLFCDVLREKIVAFLKTKDVNFRPAEKKLYDFIKSQENNCASLIDMSQFLWQDYSPAHKKTLYAYIHNIKNVLNNVDFSFEWLIKINKSCYCITSDKSLIMRKKPSH